MSRSPAQANTGDATDAYYRAFESTYRLHEEGRSFSGRERHCAFLNLGRDDGTFATVSAVTGIDFADDGRSVAAVDWDFDGDLDLWIANRTAPRLRYLQNDLPAGRRSLSVLLQGRMANRDAVGARAELQLRAAGGEAVRRVQSRHAGQGFLGQSSSWLHFGLGDDTVERLVVRWPGGGSETFEGLEAGGHYKIVEGGGPVAARAEPWQPPAETLAAKLADAPVPEEGSTTPPRALLVGRPSLPHLVWRDRGGRDVAFHTSSRPTLLNLWASWCVPCVAEFRDLVAGAQEIRAAGLEILALSVDGLDPEKRTGPADADAMLERLAFPFPAGFADAELLDKLELLLRTVFSRHIPLAVPTSLLIDGDGRLAAIYRGPVVLDRLLADVRNLGAGLVERRALATPFPGRWLAPPQTLATTTLARRFAEAGHLDDAGLYLSEALRSQGESAEIHLALADLALERQDPSAADEHYRQALALEPDSGAGHRKLADLLAARGALDEASAHYARALELEPRDPSLFYNYGNALRSAGRAEPAMAQYRQALALDSAFTDAHNNLAALLLEHGELDAAVDHLREVLRLRPELAQAHNNLGVLLLRRGDAAGAVEHFTRALELDPSDAGTRDNLAIARRALEAAPPSPPSD